MLVGCPNCMSPIGFPCSQPTDDGRRPVAWFHLAREALAEKEEALAREAIAAKEGK